MERERNIFKTFLGLHHLKATATEEPVVHLQWHNDTLHPNAPLIRLTRDDLLEELDKDSPLVEHLLHQVSTYECTRQCIVALIFDRRTVLSDVFVRKCPS